MYISSQVDGSLDTQLQKFRMFEDERACCVGDHIGMSKEVEMVMQVWETQTVCKNNCYD